MFALDEGHNADMLTPHYSRGQGQGIKDRANADTDRSGCRECTNQECFPRSSGIVGSGSGKQTGQFLFDHFKPAAIRIALFFQHPGQFRFGVEVRFDSLMDFEVHQFFDQSDKRFSISIHWAIQSSLRAKSGEIVVQISDDRRRRNFRPWFQDCVGGETEAYCGA
jgi:hypothetical protein